MSGILIKMGNLDIGECHMKTEVMLSQVKIHRRLPANKKNIKERGWNRSSPGAFMGKDSVNTSILDFWPVDM